MMVVDNLESEVNFNADPSDFLGMKGMPDKLTAEFNSSSIK